MSALYERAHSRARELGSIGVYLLSICPLDELRTDFIDIGVTRQMVHIEKMSIQAQGHNSIRSGLKNVILELKVASLSMLCCDFTVQTPLSSAAIMRLVRSAFAPIVPRTDIPHGYDLFKEREQKSFPIKAHEAAAFKSNIFLSDVLDAITDVSPATAGKFKALERELYGLTNDRAAMAILYGLSIKHIYSDACELATRAVWQPDNAKALTVVLKGLGANTQLCGAVFCEAQCLQGRGTGSIDMESKVGDRVGERGRMLCPELFDDVTLRSAVRKVLDEELPEEPLEYEDTDSFWNRRWAWCVNGGHSRIRERRDPTWAIEYKGRAHRRVAIEQFKANPLTSWQGDVYVSASEKLEPGKTRLLLACDTVSYVAFEHMLSTVERAWRNRRTLLDPGGKGAIGIVSRIKRMRGLVGVMLDYDAFNESHTLRAQQIVIEEVGMRTGYDPTYLDRLIASFDRMQAFVAGRLVGKISATLMSGHRGTTFMNSILNTAYIYAAAPELVAQFDSLHTGDDVVARFSSYEDVDLLLNRLRERGVKINPMKQSIGTIAYEFLRMSINNRYAIGYLPRSLCSLVNGNWENTNKLDPHELISTMITTTRSCINRSGSDVFPYAVAYSLNRRFRVGLHIARGLLSGNLALGSGPVYGSHTYIKSVWVCTDRSEAEEMRDALLPLPGYATKSYLSSHTTPLERYAMTNFSVSVENTMKEASYAKSLSSATRSTGNVSVTMVKGDVMRGSWWAEDLVKQRAIDGVFTRSPILMLMKGILSSEQVAHLLRIAGYEIPLRDVKSFAWGAASEGKVFRCTLPYGEAASLCAKCISGIIYAKTEIFM